MSSVRIYNRLHLHPNMLVGAAFTPLTALMMMSFAPERDTAGTAATYFRILSNLFCSYTQRILSYEDPVVSTPAHYPLASDLPTQIGERSEGMAGITLSMQR